LIRLLTALTRRLALATITQLPSFVYFVPFSPRIEEKLVTPSTRSRRIQIPASMYT
jgi:hypothetical protein